MAGARKTAKKTAKPSPRNGNRLPLGNHPGNTGGKKGRSGRPSLAFKDALSATREDPRVHDAIRRAASSPSSKGFSAAIRVLSAYDTDKPAEVREIRLSGEAGVHAAYDLIRSCIREKLAPDVAADLIQYITQRLEAKRL